MPKGYWIATISIREQDGYAEYQAAVRVALDAYGGRYLIRGGKAEIRRGRAAAACGCDGVRRLRHRGRLL